MAIEYQNMFNSHTLSDDEKSFIAKTLNVSGDLLTTMINYIETVKCRKRKKSRNSKRSSTLLIIII